MPGAITTGDKGLQTVSGFLITGLLCILEYTIEGPCLVCKLPDASLTSRLRLTVNQTFIVVQTVFRIT